MIVDGKAIAKEILTSVRAQITSPVIVRAVTVTPTPATLSYLSIKKARAQDAGMTLEVVELEEDATTQEMINAVQKEGADAVIVQLPLPSHIDTERVLDAIPIEKDADVLSEKAYERFESGSENGLLPPVVGAVKEILERTHVKVCEKKVLIIGQGKLVGKPVTRWFRQQLVEPVIITDSTNLKFHSHKADIIVSGTGSGHLIKPDMIKEGVVLIDASTSESNGVVVGDADPACAEVASVFTPVPGGVGPIAVAYLFKNVATLVAKK
jgi:methylenetetrahydrofolate dehydrogenase (NADP+)/methenyltetrahydrofolate cyclohydrolase